MKAKIPYILVAEFLATHDLDNFTCEFYQNYARLNIDMPDLKQQPDAGELMRTLKRFFGPLEVYEPWEGTKWLRGSYSFEREAYYINLQLMSAYQCAVVEEKVEEVQLTEDEKEYKRAQAQRLWEEANQGFKVETKYVYSCKPV